MVFTNVRCRRADPWAWALLALLVLLLALHLGAPRLDSDQAVTGLMGVHILRGEFPIVFWGQHHAGVPESYGAAVSFFLFGVSRTALCLVPALAALGLVLALYRTGSLLFGRGAGRLAIVFATVVSPYVVAHYVRARAYYVEHLLVGQVVLLGAALWLTRPLSEAARARALVAMGLAGGVGLYFGFQIVDALVPAGLALLLIDPRLPLSRGAWLGLGAFLLGSLPFWVYNVIHDWATFEVGVRFQGGDPPIAAARTLVLQLLPVVLGIQDYVLTPPYLPWPFFLIVPVVVVAALALLAIRVARRWRDLRRDPALAGEAVLLVTVAVTVGVVWHGRFLAVPRYLVPLAPPLALVLARACQLTWRRLPAVAVVAAGAYLLAVGIPLARDVTLLWPESRAAYRAEREQDRQLFAFLEARGLTRAYAYEYWLAPRLTFDSGARIIVAEPFNDKHPAYTRAVDESPRPAYLIRGGAGLFENWLKMLQSRTERAQVGGVTVFWGFTPPPAGQPLSRSGWTVRAGPGTGAPASLIDNELESGWASAPGPPGGAWVEVDFGRTETVAGLTLLTDQPEHVPQGLVVEATNGADAFRTVTRVETGGFTPFWGNGALRAIHTRAMTVRFPPVEAQRFRLGEVARSGSWAVSEIFALGPASAPPPPAPGVEEGRRLEAAGALAPSLLRYHAAMAAAPDDPEAHVAFLRVAGELGVLSGWPAERAARYARLGLPREAALLYARAAAGLDPDRVSAPLAEARAHTAAAAGDLDASRRFAAEAEAARAPSRRVGATFGRLVELTGWASVAPRARPGDTLDLVYHWRLRAPVSGLSAYVHFVREKDRRHAFGDDHGVPDWLPGLGDDPQVTMERRRVTVPLDTPPGSYRVMVGVWDPAAGGRLHRWAGGLVPTWARAVEAGKIEITPR